MFTQSPSLWLPTATHQKKKKGVLKKSCPRGGHHSNYLHQSNPSKRPSEAAFSGPASSATAEPEFMCLCRKETGRPPGLGKKQKTKTEVIEMKPQRGTDVQQLIASIYRVQLLISALSSLQWDDDVYLLSLDGSLGPSPGMQQQLAHNVFFFSLKKAETQILSRNSFQVLSLKKKILKKYLHVPSEQSQI